MKKFFENILDIIIYLLIFFIFVTIANPDLDGERCVGYSFILAFFAGMINNIERVLRELLGNKDK